MQWIKDDSGRLDAAEILQFEVAAMLDGVAILAQYHLPGAPGPSVEQFALPPERATRLAHRLLEAVRHVEEYQRPKN